MAQMADDPVIIYSKAMKLAKRPQEVTMVLSGLGSADSFEAIEVVKKYMQDERFKPEAFNAAINISSRYCWHDYSGTKSLMESIMAQTPSKSIRDKAGKVIDQMNRFNGNIFKWYISELYKIDGKNGDSVFKMTFDVENDITKAKWSKFDCPTDKEDIDLEELRFGDVNNCSVYLYNYIYSSIEQEAKTHMGADDRIKAWINGVEIENDRFKFRKGKNTFMIKVGDLDGGWRFRCRVTKPDDSRIENLRFALR